MKNYSGHGSGSHGPFASDHEATEANCQTLNSEVKLEINGQIPGTTYDGFQNNGLPAFQSKSSSSNHQTNGILPSSSVTDTFSLSGLDEDQPSVQIIYKSLTRESKRKLEELLQQWSRWHTQSCSSSNDSKAPLESGAETYFPSLHVGLDKQSAVTFCVDSQTKIQSSEEFIQLDDASVPLYDRGYSFALTLGGESSSLDGGLGQIDTSRCFNCSSYSHALKDCPKPRDNAAVSNARKQRNSKRIQHANSRNSSRYYQSSNVGKYEGLTPGVLDPETRKLLGLADLDPPPWLKRMREIGYPPGYLDVDEEDEPSGITIFDDGQNKNEVEFQNENNTKPSKRQSVEFPGINAPIPENADKWIWLAGSSSLNSSISNTQKRQRLDELISNMNTVNPNEQRWSIEMNEERRNSFQNLTRHNGPTLWSNMELDNERPPGCDSLTSPSLSNHIRRYGGYDSTTDRPQGSSQPVPIPWSHNLARSYSPGVRRTPSGYDEPQPPPSRFGHFGSYPY